jgi:Flp pilus assembly protein TadD
MITSGHTEQATAITREGLAAYPDNARLRFDLAILLRARGDRSGAIETLRELVRRAPDDPLAAPARRLIAELEP